MVKSALPFLCAMAWATPVSAQTAPPRFGDYPAAAVFHGKPAPPRLVQSGERQFRTVIRQGAAEGPNFAGHMTIATWGCGSGCVSIALINAKTGRTYEVPFDVLGWGIPGLRYDLNLTPMDGRFEPLSFRLDSNLLIVRGCPEDNNCATYSYAWTGAKLKLIQKSPAVEIGKH